MKKGIYIRRKIEGVLVKTGRKVKLDSGQVFKLDKDDGRIIVIQRSDNVKVSFPIAFNKDRFEVVYLK